MSKIFKNLTNSVQLALLAAVLVLPISTTAGVTSGTWMAASPQNCSPVNPKWASDIWSSANGVSNIGDSAIWVSCSLPKEFTAGSYDAIVGALNLADIDQDITCGLRQYNGFATGTVDAEATTNTVLAGSSTTITFAAVVPANNNAIFSLACKLEPKTVLKSLWTQPFDT